MKILLISDIHNQKIALDNILNKNPDIDVCLVAGDITNHGTMTDLEEILLSISKYAEKTLFVRGNCDPLYTKNAISGENIIDIEDNYYQIEDLYFVGLKFRKISNKIAKTLSKLSKDNKKIILLSHEPPFNSRLDQVYFSRHIGSKLVRMILENTPNIILHGCGHAHESRGKEIIGNVLSVNPGPVNRGEYAIITIDKEVNINVELKTIYDR